MVGKSQVDLYRTIAVKLADEGYIQIQLAKEMGWSKQRLSHYVSRLVKSGVLVKEKKGTITVFRRGPSFQEFVESGSLPWGEWSGLRKSRVPKRWISDISSHLESSLPRVHHILMEFDAMVHKSKEVVREVDGIRIRVLFGEKRGKVTAWITNDVPGLDYQSFCLAKELFFSIVENEIGYRPSEGEIRVVNFHLNRDIEGIRIEGAKSIVLEDFTGAMKRIYQKEEGKVRVEEVASHNLETLSALMRGGVSVSQVLQGVFVLSQEVRALAESVKYLNELQAKNAKILNELIQRLAK